MRWKGQIQYSLLIKLWKKQFYKQNMTYQADRNALFVCCITFNVPILPWIFGRSTSELDVFSTTVFARNKLIALKRMKFIVSAQTKIFFKNRRKIMNCSVSAHFQTCSSPIFFLCFCAVLGWPAYVSHQWRAYI